MGFAPGHYGRVDRGGCGDAVEEGELRGADEQDGAHGGLELAERSAQVAGEQPYEGKPAADSGVVEGVGERGLAGIELRCIELDGFDFGEPGGLCSENAGGEIARGGRRCIVGLVSARRGHAATVGRERRVPEAVNRERRPGGVLGTMRIRKKLLVLHTLFSGALAVILVIALRPAVLQVVTSAEMDEAMMALRLPEPGTLPRDPGVQLSRGTADELGLAADAVDRAVEAAGRPVKGGVRDTVSRAVRLAAPIAEGEPAVFEVSSVRITDARRAVVELYVFVVLAVLGVYALIAIALEVFVLPQNVYGPIRRILDAEHALQTGDSRREIIDERYIPADELGEIMRSRNESVRTLRRQEIDLAEALQRFEGVATDLKRKNHLLEAARRNLADADRLASLGMMSAGIAHELNTPLTVVKGLAEKLEADPGHALAAEEARLLKRVVVRLEQLGESLLDFARVRPPVQRSVRVASLVREAETLVRLDRETRASQIVSRVAAELSVDCDGDRIVQVLVNLRRNSVDAQRASGVGGRVVIDAERLVREGREWLSVTLTDDGPGIDQSVLETMFEPFVSSRLDAKGTGLGLAVAQGIVEEHGGVILARNRGDQRGAVFEVVLPAEASGRLSGEVPDVETTDGRGD